MLLEILYIIFGISAFGLFWTYAGYPIFIWFLSKIIKKEHKYDENYQPNVSIIIPCYNEENVIEKKLKNILELNYQKEKIEILVIDDGSKDNTAKIAENFIKENKNKLQNINIIGQERQGKGPAINNGIKNAKYEICAISDANAFLDKNALKYCVRYYADKNVGYVVAHYIGKTHIPTGVNLGESFYHKFDFFIHKKESQISNFSQCGSGWLQTFRKNLINSNNNWVLSAEDSEIPLNIIQKGYKTIFEPLAESYKISMVTTQELFSRERRITIGIIQIFFRYLNFLNFFRYGLFSLMFYSHKIFQIMTPFFIILIFISSLGIYFLTFHLLFYLFVLLQSAALFFCFTVIAISKVKEITIQPFPAIKFFTLTNIICLIAWIDYFKGNYETTWETIKSSREFKNERIIK